MDFEVEHARATSERATPGAGRAACADRNLSVGAQALKVKSTQVLLRLACQSSYDVLAMGCTHYLWPPTPNTIFHLISVRYIRTAAVRCQRYISMYGAAMDGEWGRAILKSITAVRGELGMWHFVELGCKYSSTVQLTYRQPMLSAS